MPAPNFANRTIWTGDNLDILRGLYSDSVDLIYLDPPFNSNQTYAAPVGSKAAGADLGIFKCFEERVTPRMRDVAASAGRFMQAPVIRI